jgi:glycosyltransferase involved in cell wall biosynthesis
MRKIHFKLNAMTNKFPQVSLIISTYNRPEALALCLQSVVRQTVLPNEVIVGDDGSAEETARLIRKIQSAFPVEIIHVWQEDKGFRLAMCRNKSVARCRYEYVIEIDGDVILHPRFVEDHLRFAQKGCFLKGGRVNLTEKRTQSLCASNRLTNIHFFSKGLRRRINAFHSSTISQYLLTRYRRNKNTGLGCNMSFWREDFIRINGYDEYFEGWGGEDWDFASRLLNSGVKRLSLKFAGIVFHLWHNDLYMYNKDKNFEYYHAKVAVKAVRCQHGVDQY